MLKMTGQELPGVFAMFRDDSPPYFPQGFLYISSLEQLAL